MSRRHVLAFGALLALLAAGTSPAQAPAADACTDVELRSRVLEIRFKPVTEAVLLVDQLLGPCGSYKVPKSLGVVIIEDEAERLDRIEEAVGSWDLPPRSVEIDVSLIMASLDDEGKQPATIAAELREVSRTLSEVTRWTRYRRLGSASVRLMEGGEAELEITEHYKILLRLGGVDEEHDLVQIEPFSLIRLPSRAEAASGIPNRRVVLGGDLDLEEGRMHLVGTPTRGRRRAIYLTFTVWSLDPDAPTIPLEER